MKDNSMSKENLIDLLVIGSGPGGYTAAFAAADLGLNVTLIEKKPTLGGVCLNAGCIPSKSLLHIAKIITEAKGAKTFGVSFNSPEINIDKVKENKNNVISKLTSGLNQLAKQRKINVITGKAKFISSNAVEVEKDNSDKVTFEFKKAIIASGSEPIKIPNVPDSPNVLYSSSALELNNIPAALLVVGGGYIGLELGSIYAALESSVSVVEMTPSLLPGVDADLSRILQTRLRNLLKNISLETKVLRIEERGNQLAAFLEDKNGNTSEQVFDKILIAVGRKPNANGLGLENTKVKISTNGFIEVNEKFETTDKNVFAIGDIIGQPMLAHKASFEGHQAAHIIAGKKASTQAKVIPAVVFTDPEIAYCGLTETQAEKQNIEIKTVKFPWAASGRALTLNRTDGFTKLIIDAKSEKILGVAIVGVDAGELIAEGVLAVEKKLKINELTSIIHPHPTLSETLMEAALHFYGQSPSLYKAKR